MSDLDDLIHEPRVAYFSMEIALLNEIPTYAGGLGILAGCPLLSATDLEAPIVAVILTSTAGYFRQRLDVNGRQTKFVVLVCAWLFHPGCWQCKAC